MFIDCSLPQLRVSIHKAPFDGLQLWVDDLGQWAERLGKASVLDGSDEYADENLIGSRFFARRAAKSLSSSTTASSFSRGTAPKDDNQTTETVVSLTILEGTSESVRNRRTPLRIIFPLSYSLGATLGSES